MADPPDNIQIPEGPIEEFTVIGRSNKIVRLKPAREGPGDVVDRVWDNTHFILPFDRPRAEAIVENEANWGVGTTGIDANRFWSKGIFGQGVRIGIADTGIDPRHPTFAKFFEEKRLVAFAHFDSMGQKVVQVDGAGDPVPDTKAVPTFVSWHGTFCASVLVGESVEGVPRGVER